MGGLYKKILLVLAVCSLLSVSFPPIPVARAQDTGRLPNNCAAKNDLVVKFKSVSVKNSPSGGKLGVRFDVEVTHPGIDNQRGKYLFMAIYERMDGESTWKAIASSSDYISAPYRINPEIIDNGSTSKLSGFVRVFDKEPADPGFEYVVYTFFENNTNANCSGPHDVYLQYKGDDTSKTTPPCPTNVHPIKTEELGETNVEFNQVLLAWDFSWDTKPADAEIVYKYKIATESNNAGFLRPDEFKEKQALVQFLDSKGGKNTITIYALNKKSDKMSENCKPVVFQNTEAGGPHIWIDQDGKEQSVKPGEFANPAKEEGGDCSITYIISGESNVLAGLFVGDKSLGAIFARFTDCLFKSIFRPMIDWAADLLQKAAGVSCVPIENRRNWGRYA